MTAVENEIVEKHEVTELLVSWSRGDRSALDRLTPLLYEELRRLAAAHLRRGSKQETIQPTTLVHEAYLKMAGQSDLEFQNRAQFFGLAAQVMRTILVDHARSKAAAKRGGGGMPLTLKDDLAASPNQGADILALHEAYHINLNLAWTHRNHFRLVHFCFCLQLSVDRPVKCLLH